MGAATAFAILPSATSHAASTTAPGQASRAASSDGTRPHPRPLLPARSAPRRSTSRQSAKAAAIPLPPAVGTNVDVSNDSGNVYSETTLAVDPSSTTHVFAGSNIPTSKGMGGWFSTNSGATWGSNTSPVAVAATDPSAQYDKHSNLFYSFLTIDASQNTGLAVWKNASGTWSSTDFTDGSSGLEDRPDLAVDPNDLTVSGTTFEPFYDAYDVPTANFFSFPMVVRRQTLNGTTCCIASNASVWDSGGDIDPSMTVDGSHNVFLAWDDWCGLTPSTLSSPCAHPNGQILFSKSTDDGATWLSTPKVIHSTTMGFGTILPNYGAPCSSGFAERTVGPTPSLAVDRSGGTHNASLYMVYADGADPQNGFSTVPSANRMHIEFTKSTDGGTTWTTPVQIDTGNANNDSWQPALTVDQSNGNITIAWYDRRDDANNVLYRTYYTQSTDGGSTFLSSQIPVSSAQSDPRLDANGTGDYLWIDAIGGHAHPAWTDTSTGSIPQVFTADITETGSFTVPTQTGVINGTPFDPGGSGWINLPGSARDIGVGSDCTAWVVGSNAVPYGYGLYRWTNSSPGFTGISGGGVRVSVAVSGNPRIVNSVNGIWRLLSSGWQQLPGSGTDISSDALGDLFVIGTDRQPGGGGVYSFNGAGFDSLNGSGTRIAAGPDGQPWVVNSAHQIWRHQGGGWQQLPGAALDIGVGANGVAWVIGTNPVPGGFGLWRWTGSTFAGIDGGGVAISVGADGLPWIINDGGAVYQRLF